MPQQFRSMNLTNLYESRGLYVYERSSSAHNVTQQHPGESPIHSLHDRRIECTVVERVRSTHHEAYKDEYQPLNRLVSHLLYKRIHIVHTSVILLVKKDTNICGVYGVVTITVAIRLRWARPAFFNRPIARHIYGTTHLASTEGHELAR